jgi:hypothetical protein
MDPNEEDNLRDQMMAELYKQAEDESREERVRASGDQEAIRKFEKQRLDEQISNHRLFERMKDAKDLEEQRRELYSAVDEKICSLEWANEEYKKLVEADDKRRREERAMRLNAGIALAKETALTQMALEGPKSAQLDWGDWGRQQDLQPVCPSSSSASAEDVIVEMCEEMPPPLVSDKAVPAASYDDPATFNTAYEARYQALLKEDEELVHFIIDRHRMTVGRRKRMGHVRYEKRSDVPASVPCAGAAESVDIPPMRKLSETIPVAECAPAKTSASLLGTKK